MIFKFDLPPTFDILLNDKGPVCIETTWFLTGRGRRHLPYLNPNSNPRTIPSQTS